MRPGVLRQLPLPVVGFGVEVAEGEDDQVGGERGGPALQPHPLALLARALHPQRAARVVVHDGVRGQSRHGALVHPAQVRALGPPVGEGAAVQGRPLVQGGPGPYRAGHVDRVVGEHGDVLGVRVHPQQRGLPVAPDASGARRMRVHEVDVEAAAVVQLGGVGGDALQQSGAARSGADDDEGGPGALRGAGHRVRSVPRA